jgi:hypothetical protein
VATEFGIGNETNKQRAVINTIRRRTTELITPETMGLSGRHFVPSQTNDIRSLAWLGYEFEIDKDGFLEIT